LSTTDGTLHTACPLCGNLESSDYARHAAVLWVRCACGLIYKKWSAEQAALPRPFDPASTAYLLSEERTVFEAPVVAGAS